MAQLNDAARTRQGVDPPTTPAANKMDGEVFLPSGLLMITAAILCGAMLFAYIARTTDYGATRFTHGEVARSIDLKFATREDGSMDIQNIADGTVIKSLSAKSDGFIKIVVRDLAHERKIKELDQQPRARLTEQTDGLAVLTDLDTGRVITVGAFGPPNRAVFMELLPPKAAPANVSANDVPNAGGQP